MNSGYDATPYTTEMLLSNEFTELTAEHIRSQFTNPIALHFDYIGQFIENYEYCVQRLETDEDEIDLDRVNTHMCTFLVNIFDEYLGIGFPDIGDKSTEEQHEIFHMTYRFFIINIADNFVSYCKNYIDVNRAELIASPKTKDVTSLNLKKDMIDPDDVAIIASLNSIINNAIRDMQINGLEEDSIFIDYTEYDESSLETDIFREYYNTFTVTGAFVQKYCAMVSSDLIKDIESLIRKSLLSKYKKKD